MHDVFARAELIREASATFDEVSKRDAQAITRAAHVNDALAAVGQAPLSDEERARLPMAGREFLVVPQPILLHPEE